MVINLVLSMVALDYGINVSGVRSDVVQRAGNKLRHGMDMAAGRMETVLVGAVAQNDGNAFGRGV